MTQTWTVLSLKRDALELKILPGVGGRLWDIVFEGVSLLYQNPELTGQPFDLAALDQLPSRSPQFGFPLWGGEKTWIAPDSAWIQGAPYPVLDSGAYDITSQTDQRIELRSAICPLSHLRISRAITLVDGSSFAIEHRLINQGSRARLAGLWSVMMVSRPSTIRAACDATTIRTVFGDPEPFLDHRGTRLDLPCDRPGEFKLGFDVPSGRLELELGPTERRVRLACEVPPIQAGQTFAHGHNVEVFNSGDLPYCEAEWHSPARLLEPQEALSFAQTFHLAPAGVPGTPSFHPEPKGSRP